MRVVIQRVSKASVSVGGEAVGAIGAGVLIFLGVAHNDGPVTLIVDSKERDF